MALLVFVFKVPPENHFVKNEVTTVNVLLENGFGTGNFINNEKFPYILTCKHVTDNIITELGIGTSKDKEFSKAKLVVVSKTKDFSIIEINKIHVGYKIAKYEEFDSTILGDKIYYYGLPGKAGFPFLSLGVSAQKDIPSGNYMYNAGSFSCHGGSSGATIFNSKGLGVGILCKSNLEFNRGTYGLYLKIEDIRKSLRSLELTSGLLDGKCNVKLSEMHKGPIEVE